MDCPSFWSHAPRTGLFRRCIQAFRRWRRAWRASLAAEEIYESARRQDVPREVATHAAFKALTGDDQPALAEQAAGTQPTQPSVRSSPDHAPSSAGRLPSRGPQPIASP